MSSLYFNEIDPFAAAWLGNLFPSAVIDQRSITDVKAADLAGYERVHLFGGIGGWELALHLAGWPANWPAWTGSCPCQPYSAAGKQKGQADERHLWPEMFRLIRECRPSVVFGEQVEAAIRFGWLDGVFADLEGEGYACGAVVLGAHSVGAPHIRQRIYWVANAHSSERAGRARDNSRSRQPLHATDRSSVDGLADTSSVRWPEQRNESRQRPTKGPQHSTECSGSGRVAESNSIGHDGREDSTGARQPQQHHETETGVVNRRVGNTDGAGSQPGRQATSIDGHRSTAIADGRISGLGESFQSRLEGLTGDGDGGGQSRRIAAESSGPVAATGSIGGWDNYDLIHCRDGKTRRVESGTFPLVARLSDQLVRSGDTGSPINAKATAEARQMRLRGYGNAIVPQLAATFIRAYLETME